MPREEDTRLHKPVDRDSSHGVYFAAGYYDEKGRAPTRHFNDYNFFRVKHDGSRHIIGVPFWAGNYRIQRSVAEALAKYIEEQATLHQPLQALARFILPQEPSVPSADLVNESAEENSLSGSGQVPSTDAGAGSVEDLAQSLSVHRFLPPANDQYSPLGESWAGQEILIQLCVRREMMDRHLDLLPEFCVGILRTIMSVQGVQVPHFVQPLQKASMQHPIKVDLLDGLKLTHFPLYFRELPEESDSCPHISISDASLRSIGFDCVAYLEACIEKAKDQEAYELFRNGCVTELNNLVEGFISEDTLNSRSAYDSIMANISGNCNGMLVKGPMSDTGFVPTREMYKGFYNLFSDTNRLTQFRIFVAIYALYHHIKDNSKIETNNATWTAVSAAKAMSDAQKEFDDLLEVSSKEEPNALCNAWFAPVFEMMQYAAAGRGAISTAVYYACENLEKCSVQLKDDVLSQQITEINSRLLVDGNTLLLYAMPEHSLGVLNLLEITMQSLTNYAINSDLYRRMYQKVVQKVESRRAKLLEEDNLDNDSANNLALTRTTGMKTLAQDTGYHEVKGKVTPDPEHGHELGHELSKRRNTSNQDYMTVYEQQSRVYHDMRAQNVQAAPVDKMLLAIDDVAQVWTEQKKGAVALHEHVKSLLNLIGQMRIYIAGGRANFSSRKSHMTHQAYTQAMDHLDYLLKMFTVAAEESKNKFDAYFQQNCRGSSAESLFSGPYVTASYADQGLFERVIWQKFVEHMYECNRGAAKSDSGANKPEQFAKQLLNNMLDILIICIQAFPDKPRKSLARFCLHPHQQVILYNLSDAMKNVLPELIKQKGSGASAQYGLVFTRRGVKFGDFYPGEDRDAYYRIIDLFAGGGLSGGSQAFIDTSKSRYSDLSVLRYNPPEQPQMPQSGLQQQLTSHSGFVLQQLDSVPNLPPHQVSPSQHEEPVTKPEEDSNSSAPVAASTTLVFNALNGLNGLDVIEMESNQTSSEEEAGEPTVSETPIGFEQLTNGNHPSSSSMPVWSSVLKGDVQNHQEDAAKEETIVEDPA